MQKPKTNRLESSEESEFYRRSSVAFPWIEILKIQGTADWPDRLICLGHGVTIFMEFKRMRKGRVSKMQGVKHERLTKLGMRVYVPRSCEEALNILVHEYNIILKRIRCSTNLSDTMH